MGPVEGRQSRGFWHEVNARELSMEKYTRLVFSRGGGGGGHFSLWTPLSPKWYRWGRQPMWREQLSCVWGCEHFIQTVSLELYTGP